MATLSIANPYQIYATSGRTPNVNLTDALRAQLPGLYSDLEARRRQDELALQSRGLEIEQRGLELSAKNIATQQQALANQTAAARLAGRQQAAAQKQATIGAAISGVTGIGQLAIAGKSLGLFGSAPAAPTTAAPTALTTTGTAATVAGTTPSVALNTAEVAGLGTEAGLTGASAPATTGGASAGLLGGPGLGGTLAAAGGGVASGLAGATVGKTFQAHAPSAFEKAQTFPLGFFFDDKTTSKISGGLTGATIGAAGGFALGGPVGAIAGGILGGLGGAGICILHEAAYGRESREVEIARRFRDQFLSTPALRAYYATYEPVAVRMHQDPAYRMHIRTSLTDKLVRYGAEALRMDYTRPSEEDRAVARAFLLQLERLGQGMPPFRRANGEVV